MNADIEAAPGFVEATEPPERRGIPRDAVRMLVTDRAAGTHAHARFIDISSVLRTGDLLVVNDSATLAAAVPASRASGETLTLHVATKIDTRIWMVEPRGAVLCGEELRLPGGGSAVMIAPVEPERPRLWYAWFQLPLGMAAYLAEYGGPIRYGYVKQSFPISDYQTMFARDGDVDGSAEMPSAARPFTPRVTDALRRAGVEIAAITLHCGVASFERPERPATERYFVTALTAEAVSRARSEGRRVIAVGSTALRALESSVSGGSLAASSGWTDLTLDEMSTLQAVDGILTGFHDAGATHQSLLRAFLSKTVLRDAYAEAAEDGYHSHEFGDVHLIV